MRRDVKINHVTHRAHDSTATKQWNKIIISGKAMPTCILCFVHIYSGGTALKEL
jgi:hypothetical protein